MDKERTCYLLRPRRHAWSRLLAEEADRLMVGRTDKVFHTLLQVFEATLIERALATAGGCHARAAYSRVARWIRRKGCSGLGICRHRHRRCLQCRPARTAQSRSGTQMSTWPLPAMGSKSAL